MFFKTVFFERKVVVKRFVASMFAVAIAVCFSFQTGCTPKEGDFKADPDKVSVEKKDDTKVVTFTLKVKEVTPKDDKTFEAKIDDKKVTFKALKEATDEDQKVDFKIKSEGGKELTLTAMIKGKAKAATTKDAGTKEATTKEATTKEATTKEATTKEATTK